MAKFTKKDLISTVVTGLYAGFIAWKIFVFLKVPLFYGISFAWMMLVIPLIWIVGVNFGYFLGRWMPFFNQFGRYAVIGFTNFIVDTGIANLLIALTGYAAGWHFSLFKSISFIVAVTHSYLWNSNWVFESRSENRKEEFSKFMLVNFVAIAINVGTASFIASGLDPAFGLDKNQWANVAIVIGAATALIFSFVGFRLVVFKKPAPVNIQPPLS